MKRFLLIFSIILSVTAQAQTNTWTGGSSGNWSNAFNWSLGHVPASSENVLVNTNASINVNTFSGGVNNIMALRISGGVTVRLRCSVNGARILRVSSTSAVTQGLRIEAGNTLILDATNATGTGTWTIDLTGDAGVTGAIDGTLQFEGTGAGAGNAGLDLYTGGMNYGLLTVGSTGRVVYANDSGETDGGDGWHLTMQSGAIYEQQDNGGLIPDGTWNPGSVVKLTTNGITAPLFDGNNYGDLEVNCPNLANPLTFNKDISFNNFTLVNTGAALVAVKRGPGTTPFTLTVNGTFTVSAGTVFEPSYEVSGNDSAGTVRAKGDVINNGTIRVTAGNQHSRFIINGSGNQHISGPGLWWGSHLHFVMDNPAGATLTSRVNLRCFLVLHNGKIRTDAVNVLMMAKGAGDGFTGRASGGSPASFVEGPMIAVTESVAFEFPVGKGNFYGPVEVRNTLNYFLTDTFTVEYFRVNPQAAFGANYDPEGNPEVIHHISRVEYWKIKKNPGGLATHRIEPFVTLTSFCENLNATFVARLDTSTNQWKNCGNYGRDLVTPGPPFVTGQIWGAGVPLGAGIFTLATNSAAVSLGPVQSPLPINLITFDARKLSSSKALLNWEVAEYCKPGARFDIQKAGDDKIFKSMATVDGNQTSRFYDLTDNDLRTGANYYRLKMTDENGLVTYSKTATVLNGVNGLMFTSLIPSVVTSSASLTVVSSQPQKLDIMIVDMIGRVVHKQSQRISAGNTTIQLSTASLAKGAYQLIGITSSGKTNTMRFVKE